METVRLKVNGMSCNHCKMAVEKAVGGLSGVSKAEVSLAEGQVDVSYDPGKASLEQIKTAIEDAGYEVG